MKEFTGFEYLLIDAANNFHNGMDKETFEDRIAWAKVNLSRLEALAEGKEWKEKPLYLKAVQAIRKAQAGEPIGHLVGFDAVCSGMQLMSVLTGCEAGAKATGLIDNDRRPDAYTDCSDLMSQILGQSMPNQRKSVKNAVMTSLYGSKKEPENEFGEGTPEINAFYKAMYQLCPGACELLQVLLDSWQDGALEHAWKLPDGFDARVKVMQQVEEQIEVDELNHHTFTYVWYENAGEKKGVKNAANVVHSIDAYVLRSLVRRCSYDTQEAHWTHDAITDELVERAMGIAQQEDRYGLAADDEHLQYYIQQYERSGMADVVILPHLYGETICALSDGHLQALNQVLHTMLVHNPFPIVTIHDDFKCHPNYMNHLRKHYRNILAELAESRVLDDILSQIYGFPGSMPKQSQGLAAKIRNSSYALC